MLTLLSGCGVGRFQITMQVQDGKVFNFDFSPSKSSLDTLASDFCFKHGAAFGVTQNNMRQGCVEPVVAYLRSQIPAEAQLTATQSSVKKVSLLLFCVCPFDEMQCFNSCLAECLL